MSSKSVKVSLLGRSPAVLVRGDKWVFGDGWAVTEIPPNKMKIYRTDRHGDEQGKLVTMVQGEKFLRAQHIGTPEEQRAHAVAMRFFLESDFK